MRSSRLLPAVWLCAVTLAGTLVGIAPALARPGHIDGAVRLDVHAGVGWEGSVGPGLRVDIPLARNGWIRSVDDEVALTLGVDVLFYALEDFDHRPPRLDLYEPHGHHHPFDGHHARHRHGDVTLLFPVALQWNFILSRRWTVFPEAGIAIERHASHAHLLPDLGAGARLQLGGGPAAMLFRLTYPGALQLGITW